MRKDNELHLACACHSHELHFEKDKDVDQWYISFWQRGYQTETSWIYKIKCIIHILKTGRPYGDEVILDKDDISRLKQYLEEQLK